MRCLDMSFSIITVCKNPGKSIIKTLESVLYQSTNSIEYIVVDGASTDGTLDILKEYIQKFEKIGKRFILISEPDKGIYDAMNKGLKMSTGDYVSVLGAGDYYYKDNVIGIVKEFAEKNNYPEIIYGDSAYEFDKKLRLKKNKAMSVHELKRNSSLPATFEAIFIRGDLARKHEFNLKYNVAADFEKFLRIMNLEDIKSVLYIPLVICVREFGGYSDKNGLKVLEEYSEILKQYGVNNNLSFIRKFWAGLKDLIKRFLPKKIWFYISSLKKLEKL
jgi:glycosyltransferase involved in cell wall biosynthesis